MTDVAVRELRNNTAEVLRRVQSGEDITITVNGVPAAVLSPIRATHKRRFIPKEEFFRNARFADRGLLDDLRRLDDETDESPDLFR